MAVTWAEDDDRGIADAPEGDRFGIIYEAFAGNRGGIYTVVDRVHGWPTAWTMRVEPWHSDKMVACRIKMMRELWARENERWRWLTSEQQREIVRAGGPNGW